MKKTKWFPCSVKPVHPGLYEVYFQHLPPDKGGYVTGLCRFSGGRWRKWVTGLDTGNSATGDVRPGFMSGDKWRGIQKEA